MSLTRKRVTYLALELDRRWTELANLGRLVPGVACAATVLRLQCLEREEKVLALFAEGAKKCGTHGFELSRHAVRLWVSAVRTSIA